MSHFLPMQWVMAAAIAIVCAGPATGAAKCGVGDITIKSMRAGFVNECRRQNCSALKGVAVLRNGCSEAVGVQVKIVGLDAAGAPVAARDLWPASIGNIPPGDYIFSLDHYLDYDQRIKSFTLQPVRVKRW